MADDNKNVATTVLQVVGTLNPLVAAAIPILQVIKAIKDLAQSSGTPIPVEDHEKIQQLRDSLAGLRGDLDAFDAWLASLPKQEPSAQDEVSGHEPNRG